MKDVTKTHWKKYSKVYIALVLVVILLVTWAFYQAEIVAIWHGIPLAGFRWGEGGAGGNYP